MNAIGQNFFAQIILFLGCGVRIMFFTKLNNTVYSELKRIRNNSSDSVILNRKACLLNTTVLSRLEQFSDHILRFMLVLYSQM